MGLDKKLSQLMDCPLPTNNTHIIMSTYTSTYIKCMYQTFRKTKIPIKVLLRDLRI